MGTIALAVVVVWIAWLLYSDVKERGSVSSGTWVVVAWAVLYGSRPVTTWFDPQVSTAERHDEGTQSEALVHLTLIVAGLIVLVRRRISVSAVFRENRWLLVFYLFWAMSLLWSDLPFLTAKRLFKDLGNVVMVLVILTARDPGETAKAVFLRCAYVCIPLSVVLIRYYPELGRAYSGFSKSDVMHVGVTTHKNALGTLALISALCLLWDLLDRRKASGSGTGRWRGLIAGVPVLALCWALLLTIDSATALICATFGSALLIALSSPWAQRNPGRFEGGALAAGLGLVALDWSIGLRESILLILDRDTTLTTRTDIWPLLLKYQQDPLVGAGFNTFWSGERLVQLWRYELVEGLIQAHNGYVETYLNGGVIGVALLLGLLLAGYRRVRVGLRLAASSAAFACVLILVAVIYNASEASFNKLSLLWFATLFAVMARWSMPKAEPTAPVERSWAPRAVQVRP
jgi:O-antigen ligase